MNVDFVTAIKVYFANYANFRGRSTRAEYWWAMLFVFLLSIVVSFFKSDVLSGIFSVGLLLPNLSITFRRFHDIGKSGWWVFGFAVVCWIIAGVSFWSLIMSIVNGVDMMTAIMNSLTSIGIGSALILVVYIWMLVWLVKPSGPDNKYGPNPYGE